MLKRLISLMLVVMLLAGCSENVSKVKGCGQNSLLTYMNIFHPELDVEQHVHDLLKNETSNLLEIKNAVKELGLDCQAKIYLRPSQFKEYNGYAILSVKGEPNLEGPTNHFILVEVDSGIVYYRASTTKRERYRYIRAWNGVALLLG